jgi:hypothetical protein
MGNSIVLLFDVRRNTAIRETNETNLAAIVVRRNRKS